MVNVLILSVGTRNKIVQYFKKAFQNAGRILVADMSVLAPAAYEGDRFYQVPAMTAPDYIDTVLDICRRENVRAVLSLIDPELSLLAKNEARFREVGVTVIGSSYELCERCLDKWEMYLWLSRHNYRCATSYADPVAFGCDVKKGLIHYPVFIKPIRGSASSTISKAFDRETVDCLFSHNDGLMIQEYLQGTEIGADVYIDMLSGEVVSIFTKKKLAMRAGETDKAVSFKDEKLFDLIGRFVQESGFKGQIDIDLFDVDGQYFISEVNPRFGGGYPHAYECGCDHMTLIRNNLEGRINHPDIGHYESGLYMMKYNEVMVKKP